MSNYLDVVELTDAAQALVASSNLLTKDERGFDLAGFVEQIRLLHPDEFGRLVVPLTDLMQLDSRETDAIDKASFRLDLIVETLQECRTRGGSKVDTVDFAIAFCRLAGDRL